VSAFQGHGGIGWLAVEKILDVETKFKQNSICNGPKDRYNFAGRNPFQMMQPAMATACRHPKVRIVSRHEDTEYVECLECGEVFDSEEFRDMEIEESAETQDLQEDA
jgi:hypothetical protein